MLIESILIGFDSTFCLGVLGSGSTIVMQAGKLNRFPVRHRRPIVFFVGVIEIQLESNLKVSK